MNDLSRVRLDRRTILARISRPGSIMLLVLSLLASFLASVLALGCARAELFSPAPTPLVEDRTGAFLTEGESQYRSLGFWGVDGPLNERVVLCLTAIEDRRYYRHLGVDVRSLARSVWNNVTGGDRQGASTIAMQVARLEYPAPRTAWNKTIETSTAFFLVVKFGHDRVMRHYLRIVPQGNQIFGVAYASRRFFRKPLSDVSLAEAAVLSSLPREPGRMNVFTFRGFESAKERARLILRTLFTRMQVSAEDYESALRQLEVMPLPVREARPGNSYHYIMRVLQEVRGAPPAACAGPLRSSLDSDIQAFITEVADRALGENRRLDAQNISILVADRATGEVLGYVGSNNFYDADHAGAIDYAATPRSSGSILKPFLFARGLDTGRFTPASILADLPFSVLSPQGEYRAANFDNAFLGPMLYRSALANSRNTPALRVLESVGMEDFYALARRLTLARDTKDASYYGYGLAIGGLYVTLTDLVAAYGTLANDGRPFSLAWLKAEAAGQPTAGRAAAPGAAAPPAQSRVPATSPEQIFSPYAAREVSRFLSDDLARLPSFPRLSVLEFPFPVAIKTGTSQGYRDAWTVAYTSKYIVGLWMGNPGNQSMNRVAGVVSAVYVAEILRYLHPLQQQSIDAVPFPVPDGAIPVSVCRVSGQAAGDDCPSTSLEYFRPSDAPRVPCTVHRRYAVDKRNGTLATAATPARYVALRPYTVLPAVFALWGAQHGYSAPPDDTTDPAPTEIVITYPQNGARYLVDPDTPDRFQSIPLQALVKPRVKEVAWEVDGKPFASVPWPYAVRLPLTRGTHRIRAFVVGGAPRGSVGGTVAYSVDVTFSVE
jgi:penicillin-binding protein 1C